MKIFDLIKLNNDNKDIMSRIEFIDLPGTDREENEFNKKEYYEKILKFSNCCVYVNMPNTINDGNSVERMKNQYNEDKKKIQLFLRNSFIKTCIFIINKSDELEDNNAKEKAKNDAIDIISKLDNIKKEDINISLFSGKNFSSYLKIMSEFIYPLENEPGKLFLELYKEYYLNFFKYLSDDDDFIKFIDTKIDEKEGNFNFKHKNQDIPKDFKDKVKLGMEHLEKKKYKLFNNKYDEVIEKLYNFYIKFKNFDLSESLMLFEKIKNSIEYSKKFFDKNIERNLNDFLEQTDGLFDKELVKKTEQKKKDKENELKDLKNNAKFKKIFEKTKNKIIKFIGNKDAEIQKLINSELKDISAKMEEANNDLQTAKETLQNRINEIIKNIKDEINNIFTKLINELVKVLQDIDKEFNQINNNDIQLSDIQTFNGFVNDIFASFISSTLLTFGGLLSAEAITAGLEIAAGGILGGPIGIAIGVGAGFFVGLTTFLVKYFRKEKRYKKGLELFRLKIKEEIINFQNNCLDALQLIEDDFNNRLKSRIEIVQKDIDNIDQENWDEIKEKYAEQKKNLYYLLPDINN